MAVWVESTTGSPGRAPANQSSATAHASVAYPRPHASGEVSLAGAENKLTQLDAEASRNRVIHLGMPVFREIAGRTVEHPSAHPPT